MSYRFEPISLTDGAIDDMAALLNRTFSSNLYTPQYLRWQYLENPDGNAVGMNAYLDAELAAHYVVQPLRACVFGKVEKGGLSFNTATGPAHQGKGLFTKLAEQTYERCRESGMTFIVGVANANSTPGFLRKLGFQLIGPLDAFLALGSPHIKESSHRPVFYREWSEAALKWRLANPRKDYWVRKTKANYVVETCTGKAGIRAILTVRSKRPEGQTSNLLANPFRLWLGHDRDLNWRGCLKVPIPAKLRPSPLNLIFKDISGRNRILDSAEVRFHTIDFDAY